MPKGAPLVAQTAKNLPAMRENHIPESGRSLGEGNGNPLQYSRLAHSMDRGAWRATLHGVAKSRTRLNNEHFHIMPKEKKKQEEQNSAKFLKNTFSYMKANDGVIFFILLHLVMTT